MVLCGGVVLCCVVLCEELCCATQLFCVVLCVCCVVLCEEVCCVVLFITVWVCGLRYVVL